MFWKLRDIMRTNKFLGRTVSEFEDMLDRTLVMYNAVMRILHEGASPVGQYSTIYDTDKEVNRMEQDIRRKIVEHLAMSGTKNMTADLVLMSVVKDAERLGDYCKNMYEVADRLDRSTSYPEFWDPIKAMQVSIVPMFGDVKQAFHDAVQDLARSQMDKMKYLAKTSDALIDKLFVSDLPANHAIAYTLLSRYCKRVSSHLGNIASAIVVPIPYLDFLDEPGGSQESS